MIEGRSAGGIAVGGAMVRNPELIDTAILIVPFLDVLNTLLDKNLPLSVTEWS